MNVREGQEIVVLRDSYCLEEAAALDPETMEFIAELRLQDFVAQSPNGHITRDQIQAGMRRERGLKRAWMGYLAFYAALGRAQGWKPERELLVARATGTDGLALPLGAAPGAGEPRKISTPAPRPELAPAIASDAVSEGPDISGLEYED